MESVEDAKTDDTLADITSFDYTQEEKKDLVKCPIFPVMPLGESMSGKTTLLK